VKAKQAVAAANVIDDEDWEENKAVGPGKAKGTKQKKATGQQ